MKYPIIVKIRCVVDDDDQTEACRKMAQLIGKCYDDIVFLASGDIELDKIEIDAFIP